MARWKIRHPNLYPVYYTDTVLRAHFSKDWEFLSEHITPYAARMAADRFREWRFCLRHAAGGRAYPIEMNFRIETKTVEQVNGKHAIFVRVRPRRLANLLSLNPELAHIP